MNRLPSDVIGSIEPILASRVVTLKGALFRGWRQVLGAFMGGKDLGALLRDVAA
jgi:hypothetical protein